uniref:Putative dead asp-glu-ala-asp box polypeptide 1 n=1 Tax=Ixodes ricinus TaxID=34613 RepID=A0A0K8RGX3_IXORI
MHDVIGCYLDLDAGTIKFSKNGVDLGEAFQIPQNLKRSPFFPAVVLKNAEMEFNLGGTPFKHPPADGFVAVSEAPKECIVESTVTGTSVGAPKSVKNAPQAIIIEPSRELAEQTLKCITSFKKHLKDPVVAGVARDWWRSCEGANRDARGTGLTSLWGRPVVWKISSPPVN